MRRANTAEPDPRTSLQTLADELSRISPQDGAARLAALPDAQLAHILRSLGPAPADALLRALGEARPRAVLAAAPIEDGLQWARNFPSPDDSVGRLMEPPQAV